MKMLLLFVFLFMNQSCSDNIVTIRTDYHKIDSEEKLLEFIKLVEANDCENSIPYRASAQMQSAKFAFWPTKKIKKFNQGKKILEAFIEANPGNIEARYIRVLVQSEIPKFLGYNDNIDSDIEFINYKIKGTKLPEEYKFLILKNITKIKNNT